MISSRERAKLEKVMQGTRDSAQRISNALSKETLFWGRQPRGERSETLETVRAQDGDFERVREPQGSVERKTVGFQHFILLGSHSGCRRVKFMDYRDLCRVSTSTCPGTLLHR